jgi:hypothetical protein
MGLMEKLRNQGAASNAPEQAVVVRFNFPAAEIDRIFQIEDQLAKAVETGSIGQLDGNEIAVDGRDNLFYFYGADADSIFAAIEPVLLQWDILSEARVLLRYGPPGIDTRQTTITLPKWSALQH